MQRLDVGRAVVPCRLRRRHRTPQWRARSVAVSTPSPGSGEHRIAAQLRQGLIALDRRQCHFHFETACVVSPGSLLAPVFGMVAEIVKQSIHLSYCPNFRIHLSDTTLTNFLLWRVYEDEIIFLIASIIRSCCASVIFEPDGKQMPSSKRVLDTE
jgi:hypothetical protein